MPHVARHEIDGRVVPSTNEVTDLIPKDWLIRWYRKIGFEEADKISQQSRERGQRFHEVLEQFWKGQIGVSNCTGIEATIISDVMEWAKKHSVKVLAAEAHLESRTYLYHGSPDLIVQAAVDSGSTYYAVPDYKFRGSKPPDYKTILNAASYAQMWEEKTGNRVSTFFVLNFDPETGKLVRDLSFPNDPVYFKDFLRLRRAWEVKQRALAWDKRFRKAG